MGLLAPSYTVGLPNGCFPPSFIGIQLRGQVSSARMQSGCHTLGDPIEEVIVTYRKPRCHRDLAS